MPEIKPPIVDEYVGLETYKSPTEGVGGVLKKTPEDFMVQEITPEGKVVEFEGDTPGDMLPGNYTHFTLVKRNWENMRAISEISNRLRVSRNRFFFAGTKDKNAVTAQRVAAYRIKHEQLANISIKDITVKDIGYADENLGLGSLWGNKFTIKIRDVTDGAAGRVDAITSELAGGFPNYFGRQRFGEVRPITHEVGKHMLKGDFQEAVRCYLGKSYGLENPNVEEFRKRLYEGSELKAIFRELPKSLGYEAAMINHLIAKEEDYIGALNALPKNLVKMFVHAYQSYIFNKALSTCIKEEIVVERLPLVGYEVKPDDISAKILEKEGITQENFKVEGFSDFKSRGEYRICYREITNFKHNTDGNDIILEFKLDKGSYATVLLREYMKN